MLGIEPVPTAITVGGLCSLDCVVDGLFTPDPLLFSILGALFFALLVWGLLHWSER